MYFLACLGAFLVTSVCIFLLRPLSLRLNLVDTPNHRKRHAGQVPLIGGVAMFLGFSAALLTLPISLYAYRSFIAGLSLLVFVGLLDDLRELSAKSRLCAQIIAILLMFFWGEIKLTYLGTLFFHGAIFLGPVGSLVITLVAGLGLINAINLIDGMDGLAGTVVLVQLILLVICAQLSEQFAVIPFLCLLITVLMAFLLFNFRWRSGIQAYLFMGDSGSMFLGFALLWFLIELSQHSLTPIVTPVTMLWVMSLPLFDTAAVMLQRLIQKRSIFASDRNHIHYLLAEYQYSPRQISISLGLFNFILGGVAILAFYYQISESILFFLFMLMFMLYFISISYLRYRLQQKQNSLLFIQT